MKSRWIKFSKFVDRSCFVWNVNFLTKLQRNCSSVLRLKRFCTRSGCLTGEYVMQCKRRNFYSCCSTDWLPPVNKKSGERKVFSIQRFSRFRRWFYPTWGKGSCISNGRGISGMPRFERSLKGCSLQEFISIENMWARVCHWYKLNTLIFRSSEKGKLWSVKYSLNPTNRNLKFFLSMSSSRELKIRLFPLKKKPIHISFINLSFFLLTSRYIFIFDDREGM